MISVDKGGQIKMFLPIGFGNSVAVNHIVSIADIESAPIKRAVSEARKIGMLVDCTQGRVTRAAIFMDSGHVVLSSIQPETLAERGEKKDA